MSLISKKHHLVFIHVPKTGGRSINILLLDYCKPELHFNVKSLNPRVDIHGRKYSLEAKQLITDEEWESYFKFGFVRNPWDRMVSMYEHLRQYYIYHLKTNAYPNLDKVEYTRDILKLLDIEIEDFSFEIFVKKVLRDKVFVNFHWDTQLNAITDQENNIILDFIGRFECLRRDFRTICQASNLPELTLPHLNKTHRPSYQNYFTPELRSIVEELYIDDVTRFNYSF